MWEIYDGLISRIPENIMVDEIVAGTSWTMVRAGTNVGVAMTVNETTAPSLANHSLIGAPLKAVAGLVKSWNFIEAGIGMAAINAYYNSVENKRKWHALKGDAFDLYSVNLTGKKVAVIGHFPNLEKRIAANNQLTILERRPMQGDYPDTACEYLLPQQDYVFITGSAFINKTMPRLLQISKNAKVILVGPSVPITPELYFYGVFELCGFVVTNPSLCRKVILHEDTSPLFASGERICLKN